MRRCPTLIDNDGATFHVYGTALELRAATEHVCATPVNHPAPDDVGTAAPWVLVSRLDT